MIIVHGTFPIKSEIREEAIEAMKKMAGSSRSEIGCLTYEFYVGLSNPNTILLFQEWESVEALERHWETSHMVDFLEQLPHLLAGEVATRRYEVRLGDESMERVESEIQVSSNGAQQDKIVH